MDKAVFWTKAQPLVWFTQASKDFEITHRAGTYVEIVDRVFIM